MDEKREREKERDNETCAITRERKIKSLNVLCSLLVLFFDAREREKREHTTSHALAHARWVKVLFVFLSSLFARRVVVFVVHHDDKDDDDFYSATRFVAISLTKRL